MSVKVSSALLLLTNEMQGQCQLLVGDEVQGRDCVDPLFSMI